MSDQCTHIVPAYPLLSGVVSAATFTQACEARRELMQRVSTMYAAPVSQMKEEISRSADTSRRIGITSLGLLGRDGGSVLPMRGAIDDAAVATEFVTVSLLT